MYNEGVLESGYVSSRPESGALDSDFDTLRHAPIPRSPKKGKLNSKSEPYPNDIVAAISKTDREETDHAGSISLGRQPSNISIRSDISTRSDPFPQVSSKLIDKDDPQRRVSDDAEKNKVLIDFTNIHK